MGTRGIRSNPGERVALAKCHALLRYLETHKDPVVGQKARILQREIEDLIPGLPR